MAATAADTPATNGPAQSLRGAAACLAELPGGPGAPTVEPNEADRFFEALVRLQTEAWATDGRPSRAGWLALLDAALACPPDVRSALSWDFTDLPGNSYGISRDTPVPSHTAFDALLPLLPPPAEWTALGAEVERRIASAAEAPPPLLLGLRAAFARLAGDEAAASNALASLPGVAAPAGSERSPWDPPEPGWHERLLEARRVVLATNSPIPALLARGADSPFSSLETYLSEVRTGRDDPALRAGADALASLVEDALDRGDAAAAEAFAPDLPPAGWERLALFASSWFGPSAHRYVDGPSGRRVPDPAWLDGPAAAAWRAFLGPRLAAPGVAMGNTLFGTFLGVARSPEDLRPAEDALRAAGADPAASAALAAARIELVAERVSSAPGEPRAAAEAALALLEARLAAAPDLPPRASREAFPCFGGDFRHLLRATRALLADLARRDGAEAFREDLRRFLRVAEEVRARDPDEDVREPDLLDACIEAGLFAEAEGLALALIRRGPQTGCFYYQWDAPGLAAKLYLRAGRPADALAVFTDFPGWDHRSDISAFASDGTEARTLEEALEAVGRGDEARRVRDAFAARDAAIARRDALARERVADWPGWWERAIAAMPSAEAYRAEVEIFPLEASDRVRKAAARAAPPGGLRPGVDYASAERDLAVALEAAASGRTADPPENGHGWVKRPSRLLPGHAAFHSFRDIYDGLVRTDRLLEKKEASR